MPSPIETFRLPAGWRALFAVTQVSPPLLAAAARLRGFLAARALLSEPPSLAAGVVPVVALIAMGVVPYVGTLLLSVIVLSAEGIVFNRLWHIAWDDVVEARECEILRVPHLRLRRRKGMPIWLPLYYVGERSLRDALRDQAPNGNPIRTCLTA
jgi:hypothetical protein